MPRSQFLVLVLILAACGCSKGSKGPTVPPVTTCTVTPAALAFDTLFAGDTSELPFSIANQSSDPMSGTIVVSGQGFLLIGQSAYTLAPSQSLSRQIRFAPSGTGHFSASVSTGCTALACAGDAVGKSCVATPDSLAFGQAAPGTSLPFTIRNTSALPLSGDVASVCGSFSVPGATHYTLAPGATQSFSVVFNPTASGFQSCTITTGACSAVTCTGIAPACDVSPMALDLGTSWEHIDRTFTIHNPSSSQLVGTVTESCPVARIIGPASYNLAPGASQTFTVGLTNSGFGPQTCQIDPGVAGCGPITVTDSTAIFDASLGWCAGPDTTQIDLGTITLGQSATYVLRICGSGICQPSTQYCNGFLELYSKTLSFNDGTFSGLCGHNDCRPLTATFTPQEVGMHHIVVRVWTHTAGYPANIGPYLEFRANVVVGL